MLYPEDAFLFNISNNFKRFAVNVIDYEEASACRDEPSAFKEHDSPDEVPVVNFLYQIAGAVPQFQITVSPP